MSILIKGISMPKNCYECRFGKEKQFDVGIVCTLLDGTTLDTTSRPKGICPLIEIPDIYIDIAKAFMTELTDKVCIKGDIESEGEE